MKEREAVKPGAKIAGYSVLAELGRGAASIIYLVQDSKSKQIWALKHVVRESSRDQRFLDQTEREAEVSKALDHPALRKIIRVIKIRKFMTVKDLMLVMEYVDGVSVERHPPKSLLEALRIFKQTARGLAHMHERGWIHADMKPNNIVVCEDGSVKVIDLGQSCRTGTIKDRIQGTPDYIAPEQVHRREITPKTDVYNLGATMYWALTGQHIPTAMPKGDTLVSSLDDEFIEKPSPVREHNSRVPKRLEELVMMCVEVNPEKRPAEMQGVADRLDLIYAQVAAEARAKSEGRAGAQAVVADEDDDA